MMSGQYSGVMLTAGAGLFPNPGADVGVALIVSPDLVSSMNQYKSQITVSRYLDVIPLAQTRIGAGNADITQSTFDSLSVLGASNAPWLNDLLSTGNVAADLVPNGTTSMASFLTEIISFSANTVMGNNDLSKFCQAFTTAQGYLSQANPILNSVRDSAILATTFNPNTGGMATLSTGGINQVTADTISTSGDLSQLGYLIDLGNLQDLGLPGELLAQIGRVNGGELAAITESLEAVGIPKNKISELTRGSNTFTASEERSAYTAMLAVTGADLEQVLLLLRVRVAGITNMAQLLDPRHLFPRSLGSLRCPVVNGLEPIYLSNGSVNTNLRSVLQNAAVSSFTGPNNTNGLEIMEKIIPPDQALANKALARGLGQIKDIAQTDLPALAAAMSQVETTQDLAKIQALSQPVPSAVGDVYRNNLAQGTGPGGEILLIDMIGVASGITYVDRFNTVTEVLTNLAPATAELGSCYDNMLATLDGQYGDDPTVIPTGPGAGTYTNVNQAFVDGLLPAASLEISAIVGTQASARASVAWSEIIAALARERSNQIISEIDFSDLAANNSQALMSFAASLHGYGSDTDGAGPYLQALANPDTLSGQGMSASFREGRNIAALQQTGIQLDCQIPDR